MRETQMVSKAVLVYHVALSLDIIGINYVLVHVYINTLSLQKNRAINGLVVLSAAMMSSLHVYTYLH